MQFWKLASKLNSDDVSFLLRGIGMIMGGSRTEADALSSLCTFLNTEEAGVEVSHMIAVIHVILNLRSNKKKEGNKSNKSSFVSNEASPQITIECDKKGALNINDKTERWLIKNFIELAQNRNNFLTNRQKESLARKLSSATDRDRSISPKIDKKSKKLAKEYVLQV